MLVLFVILILFVILLVFFAGETTQSSRRRPRSEQSQVSPSLLRELKPRPYIEPPPKFEPGTPLVLKDIFAPVTKSREVVELFWPSETEINAPLTGGLDFTRGEESFDWDALDRLTGQTYRVCSCAECKDLRSRHGVS
jgi:hypothetical protein